MMKFIYGTFIFFCAIFMVCIYLVAIPIIGDWIHACDIDNRIIAACVIGFFALVMFCVHIVQKRSDDDLLIGKYDDEIK